MLAQIKVRDDLALLDVERRIGNIQTIGWKIHSRQQFKLVDNVIQDIHDNEPAGLIHARTLSKLLRRRIRIWQDDRIVYVFGRINGKAGIDIEYKERALTRNFIRVGHWTLRGGKNPAITRPVQNNCLYDVVASQTGLDSSELRRRTAMVMRRDQQAVARYIMENGDPKMLGGARYVGNSPREAQDILDASQNGRCHPEGRSGHPRGHASYPSASRQEDSVETYSLSRHGKGKKSKTNKTRIRWRSGFLSRDDQDLVCHYALVTNSARNLMMRLNHGEHKVAEHIRRNELDYDPLPLAQIWRDGRKDGSPGSFQSVCLVGKHFLNQADNPNSNIFILTFYPVL